MFRRSGEFSRLRRHFPGRSRRVPPLLDGDAHVAVEQGTHVRAHLLRGEPDLLGDQPGFEVGPVAGVGPEVSEDSTLFLVELRPGRRSGCRAHTTAHASGRYEGFGTGG